MSALTDTKEMIGPDGPFYGWDDARINADLLAGKTPKAIALSWWRYRAASTVNLANMTEGSSSRNLSDIARNAQAMFALYQKAVDAELAGNPGTQPRSWTTVTVERA